MSVADITDCATSLANCATSPANCATSPAGRNMQGLVSFLLNRTISQDFLPQFLAQITLSGPHMNRLRQFHKLFRKNIQLERLKFAGPHFHTCQYAILPLSNSNFQKLKMLPLDM